MKKTILRLAIVILLVFKYTAVFAVWYQVEMIVFENLYPNTDGENWHKPSGMVPLDNSLVLLPYRKIDDSVDIEDFNESSPEALPYAYTVLPEDNNRLDGVYRVLTLSREYRPLYHISWQQPGYDLDQSVPVHVQAEASDNLIELTIPPLLVSNPMPAEFYEPIELNIDGVIQIRSSLYLHVDLDMVLFRPPPADMLESSESEIEIYENSESELYVSDEIDFENSVDNENTQLPTDPVDYVRLTESRRIKLNELHYFDHPLFGVILQVSRFELERLRNLSLSELP